MIGEACGEGSLVGKKGGNMAAARKGGGGGGGGIENNNAIFFPPPPRRRRRYANGHLYTRSTFASHQWFFNWNMARQTYNPQESLPIEVRAGSVQCGAVRCSAVQ